MNKNHAKIKSDESVEGMILAGVNSITRRSRNPFPPIATSGSDRDQSVKSWRRFLNFVFFISFFAFVGNQRGTGTKHYLKNRLMSSETPNPIKS